MNEELLIEQLTQEYTDRLDEFEIFLEATFAFFNRSARLNSGNPPAIHSLKHRLKDPNHLREKLRRKLDDGRTINQENLFQTITDLAGIRVIHLYQNQLSSIHEAISAKVTAGDWVLGEQPKAHTWDHESENYLKSLGLEVVVK
ncbi:MAG: hypothetical protein R3F51_15010 [Cyanobacteriota/Melainabacteria group bacterium]